VQCRIVIGGAVARAVTARNGALWSPSGSHETARNQVVCGSMAAGTVGVGG
jgi:hypothetical protein